MCFKQARLEIQLTTEIAQGTEIRCHNKKIELETLEILKGLDNGRTTSFRGYFVKINQCMSIKKKLDVVYV